MDADSDGDGALLHEMLALIDADDEAADEPEEAEPRGGREVVATTEKSVTSLKRSLMAVRAEEKQLTEQLEELRRAKSWGPLAAMERTLTERRKRQRAEDECQALREAVYRHSRFIRGLSFVFATTPEVSPVLDLCRYLHRHTRLPRDKTFRWGEYNALSHEARMRSAMDVLCRETESLALAVDTNAAAPLIQFEHINEVNSHSHSVTATNVFTVDTDDIGSVVRAACVAVRDIMTICPSGHPLNVSRDIVDADASAARNILYRVMGLRHRCDDTDEEVQIESHVVTSYKIETNYGLVLWDFVDDDELHPRPETTNITRETTGACLIRREVCADHVERTVFRSICTKKFKFHDQASARKLRRLVCVPETVSMVRDDEMLFRRLVLEQVAAEESAFARAKAFIAG